MTGLNCVNFNVSRDVLYVFRKNHTCTTTTTTTSTTNKQRLPKAKTTVCVSYQRFFSNNALQALL